MMFYRKSRNIQAKIKEEEQMCLTGIGPKFMAQLLPPRPDGGLTSELQNHTTISRTIHTTTVIFLSHWFVSHTNSLSISAGFSLGST
jgi:hypothetical protein